MQIDFYAEVLPALCPCHKGKFIVAVFQVNAVEKNFVDREFFDTEEQAHAEVKSVVFRAVDKVLGHTPFRRDQAEKVTMAKFDPDEPGPLIFEEIENPPVTPVPENRDPNPNLH